MCSVLNSHNEAKRTEFYFGHLWFKISRDVRSEERGGHTIDGALVIHVATARDMQFGRTHATEIMQPPWGDPIIVDAWMKALPVEPRKTTPQYTQQISRHKTGKNQAMRRFRCLDWYMSD
jgi:hypothetical protein